MELFYYCYKAPKGEREIESDKYQKLYQPEYIPEEQYKGAEYEEEAPLTYTELNESVKELEGAELEPYIPQLLLQEPEAELEPVQEEEVDLTILHNTDYVQEKKISASKKRSFKRPSFKWKKKEKKHALFAEPPLPDPAPEGANEDELGEISVDPVILLNTDSALGVHLGEKKISLDSLTEKVHEKEDEAASTASANEEEVLKLQASLESYQALVNEQKTMLDRLQRENADMAARITLTEHANGVALHDSYIETEKTKQSYQSQIAELSLYPERLKTAEARYHEAEDNRIALQDKLNESNHTISSLNGKIDMLSESINGIREKYHVVSEDNIELSAKSQEHERKVLEADEHNKNLINMVTKKDDTIEAQQESSQVSLESLRSHAASSNNFYDCEHPSASDPRLKDHYLNGFIEKDKSLTTRNHRQHDPFQYYPPYHPMSFPDPPPAMPSDSESRHFDPYFMSYLRFEQMMRTRHEFYNQMLEKEKAVSMRSVPLISERERAPSTRSERMPQYSVPFKHSRLRVDSEQSDPASSSKLSESQPGYERVESRASLPPLPPYLETDSNHSNHHSNHSNHDTNKSSVTSQHEQSSDKYFASPKTMIKSESLVKLNNDLDQLVDNCILPDSEILYPEGRYIESTHKPLGGKLCVGHANHHGNHSNGVSNGIHDTESEESSSSNLLKKKEKKSFFSRGKSKKKAEATPG